MARALAGSRTSRSRTWVSFAGFLAASALLVGACANQCDSADKPAAPIGPPMPVVQWIREPAPALVVRPGESRHLALMFRIAAEHHIQANPAAKDNLVAATVELGDIPGITLGQPVYPPGHTFVLEGSDWNLLTYDGALTIEVPLHVQVSMTPGDYRVTGSLRYQACNRRSCLAPDRAAIEITLRVAP